MPTLTASTYLEAVQRVDVTPNQSGTHAVYIKSWYSFQSHSQTTQLCALDIGTKQESVLLEDDSISAPAWLDNNRVALLSGKKSGNTQLLVVNILKPNEQYLAGVIAGPAHGLRARELSKGKFAVAFAAKRNADGTLHNPQDVAKPLSSAQYFTSTMVRQWDTWFTAQHNAVFYGQLDAGKDDKLILSQVSNALATSDSKVECPLPALGSKDCFDIAPNGIVFVAKDPTLNTSMHTKCNTYFVKIPDYASAPGPVNEIKVGGLEGAAYCPVVAPSGTKLAFLKMRKDVAESDQQKVILVENLTSDSPKISDILHNGRDKSAWDLSANTISFLNDDTLSIIADDHGRAAAFVQPLSQPGTVPKRVFRSFHVETAQAFGKDKLLLSGTSFVDSSIISVADASDSESDTKKIQALISESKQGSLHGFTEDQISEFTWKGVDAECQAFVLKPFGFKPGQKYPLCIWVHGGPQFMEADQWNNLNMNPHPFLAQGYVVVLPNPTGSRGFGQDFMDAILVEHGGKPYQDLVKLFDHIEKNLECADTSRAILGGLSYGGYMTNWIQGHDFGRKFKALFTLNGIYSTFSMLATEELFFMKEDYGGLPWESEKARQNFARWDPARHTANWATPHFIVHSGQDYRCTVDNGLAAFNTLQAKGIESAFLYFEDEPHIVSKPENLLVMWDSLLAFCNPKVGLPAGTEAPAISR